MLWKTLSKFLKSYIIKVASVVQENDVEQERNCILGDENASDKDHCRFPGAAEKDGEVDTDH